MTETATEEQVLEDGVFEQIVTEILGVMLAVELFAMPEGPATVPGPSSLVHITGARPHTVQLSVAPALGDRIAAEMFEMSVDDLDDGSRADALGELANVVGGSVKALFPGHCQLSLPTVLLSDGAPILPGAAASDRVVFTDGEHTLIATLWERRDDAGIDYDRGGLA